MTHNLTDFDGGIFVKKEQKASILLGRGFFYVYFGKNRKGCEGMQLELNREGGHLTAALIGELDHHAAADLRQRIDTAVLSCRPRRLTIDLERLTFMDSSGIGLIMGRYRLMVSLGGEVRLSGTSPRMERVIRLAGLDKLPIWDERKDVCETNQ